MSGLEISIENWFGTTVVEARRIDDSGQRHCVARRKLPYHSLEHPGLAIHLLRDELPFLEALADSEAFWA